MQTFLPYTSFQQSAACLDRQRLGKQRLEAAQILCTLDPERYFPIYNMKPTHVNHPIMDQWRDYTTALSIYLNECILEWKARGYKNTIPYIYDGLEVLQESIHLDLFRPHWLGNEAYHRSHRQALLYKRPDFYWNGGFQSDRRDTIGEEWNVELRLAYMWPK